MKLTEQKLIDKGESFEKHNFFQENNLDIMQNNIPQQEMILVEKNTKTNNRKQFTKIIRVANKNIAYGFSPAKDQLFNNIFPSCQPATEKNKVYCDYARKKYEKLLIRKFCLKHGITIEDGSEEVGEKLKEFNVYDLYEDIFLKEHKIELRQGRRKGWNVTPEVKRKISIGNKGKKRTEEVRKKMSESRKDKR